MICPKCSAHYETMACPNCVLQKNKRIAIDNLPAYAPDIRLNRLAMLLRRRFKNNGLEHIAVMRFHDVAFCGVDLSDCGFSQRKLLSELPGDICPDCESRLKALLVVRAGAKT